MSLFGCNHGELEHNVLARQTAVDGRERVELVLERSGILRVEQNFEQFRSIDGDSCPLANDFGRVDQVFEDLLVHRREGSATRTLLLDAGSARRLAQHPALSDEDDVPVGELLLQLTGQPLLNLPESLDLRHRDKNDDGLLSAFNIHLARGRDLEWAKLSLEFGDVVFEIDQGLGDERLCLVG